MSGPDGSLPEGRYLVMLKLVETKQQQENAPSRRQTRYAPAWFNFLALVGASTALRVVLFVVFKPRTALPPAEVAQLFAIGFHLDVFAALAMTLPLIFWLTILSDRWFNSKLHRFFFQSVFLVFWVVQVFLLCAEYYFFDEFKSRFNTVAVDYLMYPSEVFINIWDSYPVAIVAGACLAAGVILLLVIRWVMKPVWETPTKAWRRWAMFFSSVGVFVALWFSVHINEIRFSNERVLNEISNNGALSFVTAAWTHNLDFSAYYRTMDPAEAHDRMRRLLKEPGSEYSRGTNSLQRAVAGDARRPRLNVVILLEESLGSEFWGSLGRKVTLTPHMDELAEDEGLLFTNIYASGNRTVRGFEGVLSSFPPLPGDAIVKRDKSDDVETVARILKRDGYNTLFLYGGRGIFDGMRSFAVANGYDRFVERKHFDHPTFTTIWGVCDEDLYNRSIEEMHALAAEGKPFLATILTVSNHKPYAFPEGKIVEKDHIQFNAVKYADYCLGRFFTGVKKESFYTNTIFVVVADHGARVYGSQAIPINSYEIPLLIVGPAVVRTPSRPGMPGCSLDVSPTILGLIGRPYETMFFGRDLLHDPPADGRVMINHNRDIGMMRGDRMVVLPMFKGVEYYHGDPRTDGLKRVKDPDATDLELEKDATAIYQTADDLYTHEKYRVTKDAR